MRKFALAIRLCLSLPLFGLMAFAQQQQFANLGNFKLEHGTRVKVNGWVRL